MVVLVCRGLCIMLVLVCRCLYNVDFGVQVSVYYVGTLAKNNKRFDSCQKGKPLRFRLGRGEVIKGWDTGLLGG